MNKTRDITSAITKPSIVLGDEKVSIQDLLSYHGDKNLGYALGKTKSSLENTLSSLEDTLTKNLTPEQREYISRKYGISAENYVVLQKATEWVHESLGVAMGKVEDEVRQAELISLDERVDLIIKAVMSTRDANGNVTEGAGMEGIVQLLDIMLEQWAEVGTAVDESVALTARAKLLEMQKEEMVAEERANQIEKVEEFSSQQPFYFYRED